MPERTRERPAPAASAPDLRARHERIVAASRTAVAECLAAREEQPLGQLVAQCRAVSSGAALVLLGALARAVGVPLGLLRANDLLEALFDIALDGRTLVPIEEWPAFDPPTGVDPLPAALLDELRRVTAPSAWEG